MWKEVWIGAKILWVCFFSFAFCVAIFDKNLRHGPSPYKTIYAIVFISMIVAYIVAYYIYSHRHQQLRYIQKSFKGIDTDIDTLKKMHQVELDAQAERDKRFQRPSTSDPS